MTPIRDDVSRLIERFRPPGTKFCVVTEGCNVITGPFETFEAAMRYIESYGNTTIKLSVEPLWPSGEEGMNERG